MPLTATKDEASSADKLPVKLKKVIFSDGKAAGMRLSCCWDFGG
jgi:hypothetical protein